MRIRRLHGFTLVELLVSMLLTSIIMAAVYSVYRMQTHTVKVQENRLEAQEYARAVLDLIVREVRNAGYNPTGGAGCAGIVTAAAQTLQFALDADANGNCNGANESITYSFAPGTCPPDFGDITRLDPPSNPDPQVLTDCNVPTGQANFSFVYYPQQTTVAAPPPYCYAAPGDLVVNGVTCSQIVTANLANVQRISVSLTVQSKNPDPNFGGQLSATMTSNADLRNRGLPP